MTAANTDGSRTRRVPAIVVRQWLTNWDRVAYSPGEHRAKPEPQFYLFTLSARELRRLSGIHRRKADQRRAEDFGIQRRHEEKRSKEIARFVTGGLPWSSVADSEVAERQFADLLMPGWLPTAIVANIVRPGATRTGGQLDEAESIRIEIESDRLASIVLPEASEAPEWQPAVPPIDIIDGQHRLWAFDELPGLEGNYELPVVAFDGLDVTWQAYLFWTINIKPKRINASLAFDLYPLLRTQDWLERIEGPRVYREARAQELTEMLWSQHESPWHGRINMLGDPGAGDVTQASFIRSLLASYVKRWEGPRISIGGLFGGELQGSREVLQWSRLQQGAFLIVVWQEVRKAATESQANWAQNLRTIEEATDAPFSGRHTLLAADQGVRAVLQVTNDLCYLSAHDLKLTDWAMVDTEADLTETRVRHVIDSVPPHMREFLGRVSRDIAGFDWRASSTPGLDSDLRLKQAAFRGSGGYRDLRHQLLLILRESSDSDISQPAELAMERLGYQRE